MKRKYLLILLLSVLVNIFLIRETVKYEPEINKYRLYNRFKQNGWFTKGVNVQDVQTDSVAFILILGQSNAGNSSNTLDTAGPGVFSYYKGKVYPAIDPMIGSSAYGGSAWPLLGDSLIAAHLFKKVVFIPIAVGSTDIQNWASGECSVLLKKTLDDLKEHNVKLTHILWHQGENNNGTEKISYKNNLAKIMSVIRDNGQSAPFYCSIASFTPHSKIKALGIDSNIQQAQIEFINEQEGVLQGPNTDTINLAIDRWDAQHFSRSGKTKYVSQWLHALKAKAEYHIEN